MSTKHRNEAQEIMDDFDLAGSELQDALDKIAKINQLLGGNQLTLNGLKSLLQNHDKSVEITVLDVGCGNGDMLRYLSKFAQQNGFAMKFIGVDANDFTINYAKKISQNHLKIEYLTQDIFSPTFRAINFDVVICTLTLHHFTTDEISDLMEHFSQKATIGFVINDLHRSKIAYRLFQLLCVVFQLNKMSKEDGLLSILKGFKKQELVDFSKKLPQMQHQIQWKWAFRYQWIGKKMNIKE